MAWRCGLSPSVPVHPTHCLICAQVDKRLTKLRTRCGFEEIVVLRNRRRAFGVGESAFDSYGPSFFDQSDAALLAPDVLKTRDLDPMAPEAFPAPDKATRKWLREKRAEAM